MGDDGDGRSTTPSTTGGVPAGWYPDPSGHADLRWWSGGAWTDETRRRSRHPAPTDAVPTEPAPRPAVMAPPPAPAPEPPAEPVASRREWKRIAASRRGLHHDSPNTPAVWVLAFLPMLSLAWGFASIVANPRGSIGIALALAVIGLALYLVLIVWDRVGLARNRLRAPSLWWQLLPTALVYLIVRRVVLRRQGIISHAPGNVFALVFVAAAALSFVTYLPVAQAWTSTVVIRLFEQTLVDELEGAGGGETTVDCPSDAPLDRPGERFDCLITQPGTAIRITMEVLPGRHLGFVELRRVGDGLSAS